MTDEIPHLTNRARQLRRDATDAEKRIWKYLRSSQLQGAKFRRQVPIGPYICDFVCHDRKLIVEIDGGQHTPERDERRSIWLESQGYKLLRFWNNDVLENTEGVWMQIQLALRN